MKLIEIFPEKTIHQHATMDRVLISSSQLSSVSILNNHATIMLTNSSTFHLSLEEWERVQPHFGDVIKKDAPITEEQKE